MRASVDGAKWGLGMRARFFSRAIAVLACASAIGTAASAAPFTINDAIRQAVQTNPTVGEAAANRRATEAELRQTQSTLLPQVRLEALAGPERLNNPAGRGPGGLFNVPPGAVVPPCSISGGPGCTTNNDQWVAGAQGSIAIRQLLFDGFASIHDIWRQAARVDAAAARTHERSELIALDASEAYIDVVRYTRLIALAEENVKAHRSILGNVRQRFQGGRAGQGDLEQTVERVEAAEVTLTEFRRSLEDARAKFRKAIGIEPYNLRGPGRLRGLPPTRDQVLAVALTDNPTIKAAQADTDAARQAFHQSAGRFMPTVSLEARASQGHDTNAMYGHFSEESLKVVATWDVFRGGQDLWNRVEQAERYNQTTMAHARLQRDANESIDRAWAARVVTVDRIARLEAQVSSAVKVIEAYSKEYDLGQRSLIDLLNAENQSFNAQVSLISARSVVVFADYQLLAAMGKLLAYVRAPHPVDAEPLVATGGFGLVPVKLPPILVGLPQPGSEPLNVAAPPTLPRISGYVPPTPERPPVVVPPGSATQAQASEANVAFSDRWYDPKATAGTAPALSFGQPAASGYSASGVFTPSQMQNLPQWPMTSPQANK
jgi:outer membrane protein, adhesin transport system